jgi:hypothetical protein
MEPLLSMTASAVYVGSEYPCETVDAVDGEIVMITVGGRS